MTQQNQSKIALSPAAKNTNPKNKNSERKTTPSSRKALRRKIERTVESINRVIDKLDTTNGPNDARIDCLGIDAERLANFCQFIRKGG